MADPAQTENGEGVRKMKSRTWQIPLGVALILLFGALPASAEVRFQCPANLLTDGTGPGGVRLDPVTGFATGETDDPNVLCIHLAAGDGFVNMADKLRPDAPGGWPQYIFSFSDVTGVPDNDVITIGTLQANFSAPTIKVREGQDLYLTLTNVGMVMRPDLFDPHSVHYHGFPNASAIFDGVPDASVVPIPFASFTYFYPERRSGDLPVALPRGGGRAHADGDAGKPLRALGAGQDDGPRRQTARRRSTPMTTATGRPATTSTSRSRSRASTRTSTTCTSPSSRFPSPRWTTTTRCSTARGYPDTTLAGPPLPFPVDVDGVTPLNQGVPSQNVSALITATQGQKILLRISSLSTTSFHNLEVLGIPMTVIAKDARLLRGPSPDGGVTPGIDLSYGANSISLGGGQSADVILDTAGVAPGTYFLYARELNHMNNNQERFGGMMTEIRITP